MNLQSLTKTTIACAGCNRRQVSSWQQSLAGNGPTLQGLTTICEHLIPIALQWNWPTPLHMPFRFTHALRRSPEGAA